MLYIDYEWFYDMFKVKIDKNNLFYYKLKQNEYREMKKLFSFLENNIDYMDKEIYLIKIIDKYFIQKNKELENIKLNSLEKKKIENLKRYIENNFNNKITLEQLTDISGLSKYHLIRVFKENYKISPLTYQRNLRFNFAKQKLKEGNDIAKIAVKMGYYDQSHFTNEFQKFSGTTPDDYRKNK